MSQAYDGGPRCCAIVSRGELVKPQQCRNRATVNIGGALYCAVHYPEKVQARQATRDQTAQIDRRARETAHRRARELEAIVRALCHGVDLRSLVERARALFPDEK